MIVTFLGTSSATPTLTRNVSAIALSFTRRGRWWLFDCGEGTQQQIMRTALKLSRLENIFITHLHGDHLYGLMGLLASRSLRGGSLSPVTVYGPPGLERYVEAMIETSGVHLQFPLRVEIVAPGRTILEDGTAVACAAANHRGCAFSYAVIEPEQPGAFRADLAKQAGIPPGPLYGRLKRGETVHLPDGRSFHGKQFVGPPQPGRKIVYSGDTAPCEALVELAKGADLLIHEATFAHAHRQLAERSGHATALQAARIARQAGVRALVLRHFSPRYDDERAEVKLTDLLREAQSVFPHTSLAADFLSVSVKRERNGDAARQAGSVGDEAQKT
jgi:ribonuclease Z